MRLFLLISVLAFVGCVETDGPHQDIKEVLPCPQASPKRKAVPEDMISAFPPCCDEGSAYLIPKYLVPETFHEQLTPGPDDTLCVPTDMAIDAEFTPQRCSSIGGREGRCVSVCIQNVAADKEFLPYDICKEDERCAPCFDPRNGAETGACTVGPCDEPSEPSRKFEACGVAGDDALCVPRTLVPESERCHFDTKGCGSGCSEEDTFCVPKKAVYAGAAFDPKKCKANMSGFLALFTSLFKNPSEALKNMEEYSDGVCLSKCLPEVRDNPAAALLGKSSCDSDERCIPCYDPQKIAEGKIPTGACARSCDMSGQTPAQ